MAHPINNISYLLSEWDFLKDRYPHFAFFLFDQTHTEFATLFEQRFAHWHDISADGCMYFAIGPPPDDWQEKAEQLDYWQHYMANSSRDIGYSSANVRQAARYFGIPWEYLPAIVLFNDIRSYDTLSVHLVGLAREEIDSFIHNFFLLLNHPLPKRYGQLWKLQSLIDRLPRDGWREPEWIDKFADNLWIRRRRQKRVFQVRGYDLVPLRRTYVTNTPERLEQTLTRLAEEVERLTKEVGELRREQRESFGRVSQQLERIEVVLRETVGRINEFRGPFVERWVAVDSETSDPEQVRAVKEQLHAEFDDFLEAQSYYLSERIRDVETELPAVFQPLESLLEDESKQGLMTSELLWLHLNRLSFSNPIDFSVCGIGLWKALEIEVNRTFIDALRIWNNLCQPGIPSIEQPVLRGGKVTEPALFGDSRGEVRINARDRQQGSLLGVSLGSTSGILRGSKYNSLAHLMHGNMPVLAETDTLHDSLGKLGEEVSHVTRVYRNTYSHIRVMVHHECNQLRDYMLDDSNPFNPLLATLTYKRAFLRDGLI